MEKVNLRMSALSLAVAVIAYFMPLGLEPRAHVMFFVMVFVAVLWVTESAPLYATAILAGFLLVTLVGISPSGVFSEYFNPVVVLLLGGFAIAVAMRKYGLDAYIANRIMSRAGSRPSVVILALMSTAVAISMWISNSATAAIVMPVAIVILAKNKLKKGTSNFGKAAVLAVGYGATIGGMGTIIGSTPNVISAGFLSASGIKFGFFEWFWRGFPFMLLMMLVGWAVLMVVFRPEKKKIEMTITISKMTRNQKKVLAIFLLTVVLWITEGVHGINNSVVALVPFILFYFTGILGTPDFSKIDWPTLVLVGGGLALGMGIHATALDSSIASVISGAAGGHGILALFFILGLFGVLLTVFISNTTAAAVYLPIVVALASSFGADVTNTVVVAALGVSLDFIFPFGTPPTAIAYGTGYVRTKDIAKAGILISILGIILLSLVGILW